MFRLLDADDTMERLLPDEQGIEHSVYSHADMQVLNKLLTDVARFLPYLAISKLACGMCFNIIEYESRILNIVVDEIVRGSHGTFYPENWAIPEFCLRDENAIHNLEALIERAAQYEPVLDLNHQDYFLYQ